MQQRPQGGGPRPADRAAGELIGGRYAVDAQRLTEAGAGLVAFAAHEAVSGRGGLMALQVRAPAPPRPRPLATLLGSVLPGLLTTHAFGAGLGPAGAPDMFVVCDAPAGPPVGTHDTIRRRWGEGELLGCVLRPIGAALQALQRLRLTHRAIRPENVFQGRAGQPVVLGPGWAAPPACFQPACFEPPYVSACLASGRGDGSLADDVYALGVLLLALAAGQVPMAGLEDAEVVRRKRGLGSFAALSAGLAVSPTIAELVRGMLADDPDHRPSPAQLQDPEAIRGRRLAIRPARVAIRPLDVAGQTVWHARALAGALAGAPGPGAQALRGGLVERWLRRQLGEPALATLVEEAVRARGADPGADPGAELGAKQGDDAVLLMRAVALLDPLAPLCWGGLCLWPDGLGPALAAATPVEAGALAQMVDSEALAIWAASRPERCDVASLRAQARDWRMVLARRDWSGGALVLTVQLNPLKRCASTAPGAWPVVAATDLLPALERVAQSAAARPDPGMSALPIDRDIAAFIAGHDDFRLAREVAALGPPSQDTSVEQAAMAQLRLLARMQTRLRAPALPALAASLAAALRPGLARWRSLDRRGRVEAAMARQAAAGALSGLLQAVEDPTEREADGRETEAARAAIARIDAEIAHIEAARADRAARARRVGLEVTAALGVIAVAMVAAALVL